jgi:mannose-6-phosphate isomerase
LLERLLGYPSPADGDQPEAWFGAINAARPTVTSAVTEGLGRVVLPEDWRVGRKDSDNQITVLDLIDEEAEVILGPAHVQLYGKSTAVLLKVLDSVERLTVQVHPNQAFAQRYLGSRCGKDEAWVVLGVREDVAAHVVYYGLRESITSDQLSLWVGQGDITSLLDRMYQFQVDVGDVLYVPAGTIHAIGAGLLIAEVQEPTDFTFSFDREFGGRVLSDDRRFLGLNMSVALSAARLTSFSELQIGHLWRVKASSSRKATGPFHTQVTRPIGLNSNDRFWVELISVGPDDELVHPSAGSMSLGVATLGAGLLKGRNGRSLLIRQGDGFLIPAMLGEWSVESHGAGLQLVVCGPQSASIAASFLSR